MDQRLHWLNPLMKRFQNRSNLLPPKLGYTITNLSRYTRALGIDLIMERVPNANTTNGGVTLSVETLNNKTLGGVISIPHQPLYAKFNEFDIFSRPVNVYQCLSVNFTTLTVQFSFSSIYGEYNGVQILFKIGNAEFVLYEILFRIFFSISLTCFSILFLIRLRSLKIKNWHLEQKLTILLLLVVALYNNPLYGTKFADWSTSYIFDAIFKGIAVSYSIFFLLILFDNFRFKNRETTIWFFVPKIVITFFLGIIIIAEGLLRLFIYLGDLSTAISLSSYVHQLQLFISPTLAIASLYVIVTIGLAMREVDPTERYKLNLYILTFSICLLAGLIGYHFHRGNALIFTIRYAIISLISILLTYFHWPYEIKKDLIYDEQDPSKQSNQPQEFILNQD